MEVWSFEFDWLIDLFAGMYNIFFGSAAFLNFTPATIGIFGLNGGEFVWSWFNAFNGLEYSSTLDYTPFVQKIMISLPFQGKPIWFNVLVIMPTLFIAWFVIKGIIHAIKSVVF
jgi:hypothetical protein